MTTTAPTTRTQDEITEGWLALSQLRSFGSAVSRARVQLAADAADLAAATTPMAMEDAAGRMALHATELQDASQRARTHARVLYLLVPDHLRQDVAAARTGAYGERISSWLSAQEDALEDAPAHVCGVATFDGNNDDPTYAYCGHPRGHAGDHGAWVL